MWAGVQVSLDLGRKFDQILTPFCAFPRLRLPLPAQQALGASLRRSVPSAAAESSHQCCTHHDARASPRSLMRRGSGYAHRERVQASKARLEHTASGRCVATKYSITGGVARTLSPPCILVHRPAARRPCTAHVNVTRSCEYARMHIPGLPAGLMRTCEA